MELALTGFAILLILALLVCPLLLQRLLSGSSVYCICVDLTRRFPSLRSGSLKQEQTKICRSFLGMY